MLPNVMRFIVHVNISVLLLLLVIKMVPESTQRCHLKKDELGEVYREMCRNPDNNTNHGIQDFVQTDTTDGTMEIELDTTGSNSLRTAIALYVVKLEK